MSDLDKKILEAIKADSNQNWEEYSEEKGLFGLVGESFKGKLAWVVKFAFVLIFTFIGLLIYCAYHMLHAPDLSAQINWLAGTVICAIIVSVLRLWYLMELNRLSLRREIKRLELLVSRLIKDV